MSTEVFSCPTPFCVGATIVADSRPTSKHGGAIRRRRKCLTCNQRFTTFEVKAVALADSEHIFETMDSFRKLKALSFDDWIIAKTLIERLQRDTH